MMKECTKCEEVKPYSDFYKDKREKDGLQYACKNCQKQYYKKNKEKHKQYNKQYYEKNKEKIEQKKKQYRKKNREKIKQYLEENKERNKKRNKQYYEENKEKLIQCTKKYIKQRRRTDPIFRLTHNIRRSINRSLKNKGYSKKTNTYKILGLEYEAFYTWLNTEASNGLSFDRDDVHVDHVIPVSFGKTEEQVLALNHYSNLQLLTSEENLKKHNTYIKQSNLDRVMKHHPNNSLLTKILLNYNYIIF